MLPLVVQIEKVAAKTARTCAFRNTPVRVGRNPLNDLRLEESFVSQWHGVIRFDEEGVRYLDLGSTNPTQLDGVPIQRNIEIVITPESDLRIGGLRLHLLRGDAPAELFGAARRSSFAQVGHPELGDLQKTMYLAAPADVHDVAHANVLAQASALLGSGGQRAASPSHAPPTYATGPVTAARGPSGPPPGHELAAPGAVSIDSAYASYRRGWADFLGQIEREMEGLPRGQRAARVSELQARFPAIAREPEFRKLVADQGVNPLISGEPDMGDWFRRLTDGMFPPMGAQVNRALAMERLGSLLEVFAGAFVELRSAQDAFCKQMSLEAVRDESSLWRIQEAPALLAFLLDPGPAGTERPTELMRAMADFTVHQVALVTAVVEGARAMLEELGPDRLRGEQAAAPARAGLLGKLFPRGGDESAWERYQDQYEDLTEEDRFTRVLFGRKFARRYYAVSGGRAPKS
jgi:predicted component of type VI protein secretion system